MVKTLMDNLHQLPYLLKLLDDESPETQAALAEQFFDTSGDLSDPITAMNIDLSAADRFKLSTLLRPARAQNLAADWIVPMHLNDDWESLESLLRQISDFLHDGVTLRASLSDQLDLLAEEAEHSLNEITANHLRKWLFESDRFSGDSSNYYHVANSDLCNVIEKRMGNPVSLATIFYLIGRRLDLEISTSNYPGHFLARVFHDDRVYLVDCFNSGKLIPVSELLEQHKDISVQAKHAIHHPCTHNLLLLRFLRNIEHAYSLDDATQESNLMKQLQEPLMKLSPHTNK